MTAIDLSIVIVSYNVEELLKSCLESIFAHAGSLGIEVIVVDNASKDNTGAMIRAEFPYILFIANAENQGFSAANNQAIRIACGKYIMLLNPDTIILENALQILVDLMDSDSRIGIAGPKLLNPDGTLQTSCFSFPNVIDMSIYSFASYRLVPRTSRMIRPMLFAWDHSKRASLPGFLLGAAIVVRREVLETIGLLDTGYFVYGEEKDLGYRVYQSGYKIIYDPAAQIVHYGGQSSAQASRAALIYLYDSHCYFLYKHYEPVYAALLINILYAGLLVKFAGSSFLNQIADFRKRTKRRDAHIYWHTFRERKSKQELLASVEILRSAHSSNF